MRPGKDYRIACLISALKPIYKEISAGRERYNGRDWNQDSHHSPMVHPDITITVREAKRIISIMEDEGFKWDEKEPEEA